MWEIGGTVAIGAQVRDSTGTLVNAGTMVLTLTLPDGTSSTPGLGAPSPTGVYTYSFTATQAGHYTARWVSTSPATAYTDTFNVQEAAPPLIVGLDEAKDYLNIASTETTNDEELRTFVEAATRIVEHHVGAVVRRPVTSVIYPTARNLVHPLPYNPVISLTSGVTIATGVTLDLTGYVVEYGSLRSSAYLSLPYEPWTLTYVVGLPVIPANIRLATLEVIKDLWSSQRGAGGPWGGQQDDVAVRLPFVLSRKAEALLEPDRPLTGIA